MSFFRAALWFCLVVFSSPAAKAADAVAVTVVPAGDNQFQVSLHTRVRAAQQALWKVLTDYDHHAGMLPYMSRSRLTAVNKDFKTVEQQGSIRILFWIFTMQITQHVFEEAPAHMRFKAVAGDFKRLQGDWHLTPSAAAPASTQLDCRFLVQPKRRVPLWAVRMAARHYLAKMVQRLQEEAEKQ